MKSILVTGSNGLLGHALRQVTLEQIEKDYEFVFVDIPEANLLLREQTLAMFNNYKPEGVIHLAADVGGLFKNMAQNVEMFENNLIMNMNVMKITTRN